MNRRAAAIGLIALSALTLACKGTGGPNIKHPPPSPGADDTYVNEVMAKHHERNGDRALTIKEVDGTITTVTVGPIAFSTCTVGDMYSLEEKRCR